MIRLAKHFGRLVRDSTGTTVIETAIVAPVLALMALGSFDISRMVARQHELQNGAGDMESIVLASAQGQATDTATIKTVLTNTLGLPANKLAVVKKYRCGTEAALYDYIDGSYASCSIGTMVSVYVQVTVNDTYTPTWTNFGVGGPINYNVTRMVQVLSAIKS